VDDVPLCLARAICQAYGPDLPGVRRGPGGPVANLGLVRLSPLKDRYINFLGRYLFNIKAGTPGQGLRPLRDADAVEDDEGND
jgi:hypothetical protein